MFQGVGRRSLTAETQFRSPANTRQNCGGQSGSGAGFFPEHSHFTISVSFYLCSILTGTFLLLLSEGQADEASVKPNERVMKCSEV